MKKHLPKIVLVSVLLILLSVAVIALTGCSNEFSFVYRNGAIPNELNAISNYPAYYCGLKKGDEITIYAKYPILSSGVPTQTKTPLIKITLTEFYNDKLYGERGWSYDNDAWDFKFDLLKPDGTALKSFEKEFWEISSEAQAADRTWIDLSLPNGDKAFHIELFLDSQSGTYITQVEKLYIKAEQDVGTLIEKLSGAEITAMYISSLKQDSEIIKEFTEAGGDKKATLRSDNDFSVYVKKFTKDKDIFAVNGNCPDSVPSSFLAKGKTQEEELNLTIEKDKFRPETDGTTLSICQYNDTVSKDSIKIYPKGVSTECDSCDTILKCLACIDKRFVKNVFE